MTKLLEKEIEFKATHFLCRFLDEPYSQLTWESLKPLIMEEVEKAPDAKQIDVLNLISKYISGACAAQLKIYEKRQSRTPLPWSLYVVIVHDGDVGIQHQFFRWDDLYTHELYGSQAWETEEQAVEEATRILTEMKSVMDCKPICQDRFEHLFNQAIQSIQSKSYANEAIYDGNYFGTEILFGKYGRGTDED